MVNQYTTPQASGLYGFVQGSDGNMYFNEAYADSLAQVTPAGVFREFFAGDRGNSQHLAEGPDGNIWTAEYYGFRIGQIGIAPPTTCKTVNDAVSASSVAQGDPETVTASVKNCASTPALLKVATRTTPPSGCGTATTVGVTVPLAPHTGTVETSTFNAPSCAGTYKVKTTVSVGGSVIDTSTVTYQVS